jgi:ribose transport system permease protein
MKMKIIAGREREAGLFGALIVMILLFGAINPSYLTLANLGAVLDQASIFGLIALGMTLIIISGGIDLSVGSAFAFIGVSVAWLAVAGTPTPLVILAALGLGLFLGLVNGLLVSIVQLQPFIATLGTMAVFRGLAFLAVGGLPVLGVPTDFRDTVDGLVIRNLRISVFIFLAAGIAFWVVLKKTAFGSAIFAIGGNEEAARVSGIRTLRTKVLIYSIAMLGTALAAIVQIGKLGTGEPSAGQGYELFAIAAVAIGGTSMLGGRGSILGTMLGALLLSALRIGLITSGVDTFYQYVATGLVVIIAASAEVFQSERFQQWRQARRRPDPSSDVDVQLPDTEASRVG